MYETANPGRDAFTFSLRGLTAIASFTLAPAIADDELNKAIDGRLAEDRDPGRSVVRDFEEYLARYFAPGQCGSA